ncbi:MAG: ankyrin repeat domain-containing protein [Betaproteobacteria bacterium]
MDDEGVVGLVDAYEHSVDAGTAVATREPRLIRERTSLGETALHLLVMGQSHDAVRSILRLGADVRAVCAAGESPLSVAASLGRVEFVQTLLAAGAPVTVEGQLEPTLHKGVRSGNVQIVRLLLDAGANVNEQADFAEAPIHIAAEEGFSEVVELLLSKGADANLKSTFGGTALDVAKAAGQETCVVLLSSRH